jgi:hypothetical protein
VTADDLLAGLGSQRLASEVARHRHRWVDGVIPLRANGQVIELPISKYVCRSCGAVRDPVATRKGRNNRARGNAYERDVAKRLGLRRVGQYGSPTDAGDDHMAVQVKVGGAFPELPWRWLQALPRDRLRAVVIGDAPGSAGKRREVIVLDFADFVDWYGGAER